MIPKFEKFSETSPQKNVFGDVLEQCSMQPLTGFFRNGCCDTHVSDKGSHTVCAVMNAEFLAFSKASGNDLSSSSEHFPGLKPGDKWCLCAGRWLQAYAAGCAPKVFLNSCNLHCLEIIPFDVLEPFGVEAS